MKLSSIFKGNTAILNPYPPGSPQYYQYRRHHPDTINPDTALMDLLLLKEIKSLKKRVKALEKELRRSVEDSIATEERLEPTHAANCIKLAETYAEIRAVLKRDGKGDHQDAQDLFDDFKTLVYQSCKSDVTRSVFELILDKIDEVNLEDLPQLEMICRYFSPDNTDHQKQAMLILQSLKEDVSSVTARFNNILNGV